MTSWELISRLQISHWHIGSQSQQNQVPRRRSLYASPIWKPEIECTKQERPWKDTKTPAFISTKTWLRMLQVSSKPLEIWSRMVESIAPGPTTEIYWLRGLGIRRVVLYRSPQCRLYKPFKPISSNLYIFVCSTLLTMHYLNLHHEILNAITCNATKSTVIKWQPT